MTETGWTDAGWNEPEWFTSDADWELLLNAVKAEITDRKRRLFAAACCRRIEDRLLKDGEHYGTALEAIKAAEQFADGLIDGTALYNAGEEISCLVGREFELYLPLFAAYCTIEESTTDAAEWTAEAIGKIFRDENGTTAEGTEERMSQIRLLQDIVGPLPFRPIAINPSWLTSSVLALATGIYSEKAFDRIPILADALQDAGCDNEDILNHCRQPGEHVRGCWVIDLVLSKK